MHGSENKDKTKFIKVIISKEGTRERNGTGKSYKR